MLNVPKLRFSEFSGAWEEKLLGNLIEIQSGLSPSSYKLQQKGKYPFLKVEDLNNCEKYQYLSRNYSSSHKNLVKMNSVIFPKRGAAILLNKVRINKCEVLMDSNLMAITPNIDKLSNEYLFYKIFKDKLYKIADTSTIPQINNKHILPYKIWLPQKPEQQKIATFLTAIDKKIEQLTEKEKHLQAYKKGVMQKIFSQEIRFRDDGGEFGDWVEKKFKEVFERVTRKNKENNLNVLTISAQQGLINQEKYFNKSVSAKNVTGYYLLHKNEFAYNKSYSKGYPMGAIKRLKNYDKGVVSTLYICFKVKDSNPLFWEHFFESGNLTRELHKIAQEGARNHGLLNISIVEFFNDITLKFPSLKEQTKIANFLSSIDQKIEQVTKQIEESKKFKKGLLQQMFV